MNHDLRILPVTSLLAGAVLAACTPAGAAEGSAAASRIERVTVYPGLALVERSAKVAAGARELVLDCLSASFDMASLQIDGAEGVRLGPVSATTRPRNEVPACDTSPLDGRIRTLEDRIAALQAESGGHDLVLGYLRALVAPGGAQVPAEASASFTTPPGSRNSRNSPGSASLTNSANPAQAVNGVATLRGGGGTLPAGGAAGLQALLGGIQNAGQNAYGQQHRLGREREALERELQPLLAERERQRGQSGEVRQLRVALAASREAVLRLRYQVPGPSWAPAYRATLEAQDTAASTSVLLERLAHVSQRTGEDWAGVRLALSTGSPRSATAGPQPRPWTLQPRPAYEMRAMAAAPMPAPAAAPMAMAARKAEASGVEPDFTVQQINSEFATEFEVPGSVDVGSGGQRVSLSLGSQRVPAALRVQSVPQQDASAWFVAEISRPEGVWPEGPMQLLRGTQAVGQSQWRGGEQEKLTLPFGRDELVRVRVLPAQQHSASTGFISTRNERQVGRVYEVENRHRSAIDLLVLEASPVALEEQIGVTRSFNPKPQVESWLDQPGIVAWRQSLGAGQKARFSADYTISHPKDMVLRETR